MMAGGRASLAVFMMLGLAIPTGDATPSGQVTKLGLEARPSNHNGRCPATIRFMGEISVDGPNTFSFGVFRSDGAKGIGQLKMTFTAAGQRRFTATTWRVGRPGEHFNGWVEIGSGNVRTNKAAFTLNCSK